MFNQRDNRRAFFNLVEAGSGVDGSNMRRVIAIAVAGFSLAGCSSFSMDYFKSAPPTVQVQLDSTPPGADARTSVGPGCKTPCSVTVPVPDAGFTVTYTLNRFQPATVPVQVIRVPGDLSTPATTTVDPNPVVAELQPAGPPPRGAARKKVLKPKKPKPPKAGAAAPPPGAAGSPFPDPGQQPPPPPPAPTR
jgi:hypothetical protein